MADYGCHPLWLVGSLGVANIDPREMPISQDLVDALLEWAQRYDRTLVRSDPRESRFQTPVEHLQFVHEGWLLASRLAIELGEAWAVAYFNDLTGEATWLG